MPENNNTTQDRCEKHSADESFSASRQKQPDSHKIPDVTDPVYRQTEKEKLQVKIRRMRPEDVPAATALEAACFSEPWSEQAFSDALQQPDALMVVAMQTNDGKQTLVGYCGIYLSLDEGEITNVAVCPEYRKQGIADQILDAVFAEAKKRGTEKIYLEVRESNLPAQHLYQKHGFASCGIRKNFYRKPTEHAIVMCADLERTYDAEDK